MSDFDQLDKWIDKNTPSLNKKVLHTQVASITDGESGGGGNPNETGAIEGTLFQPFGLIPGLRRVIEQMGNGNLSGTMEIDASVLGEGIYILPMISSGAGVVVVGASITAEETSSSFALYNTEDGLAEAWMAKNGVATDITAYAANIPTVFRYIYHPLPTNSEE